LVAETQFSSLDRPGPARRLPRPVLLRPIKHNRLVAGVVRAGLKAANFRLERVIFTATTGRSGTLALARLFSAIPGCIGLHEPYPEMNGELLHAATYGNVKLVDRVYRRVKSINILRAALGRRFYFESNHLFLKVFMDQALADFGERAAVIHVVRPALEVATSIYRLQEEPGTTIGNYWWLDHHAPTNLIRLADILDSDQEFSHPFYKALWYWYEIEMRAKSLRRSHPNLRIVRFETGWINEPARVRTLLNEVGIEYDASTLPSLAGERINVREVQKGLAPLPSDQTLAMQGRFERLLSQRDIDLSAIG